MIDSYCRLCIIFSNLMAIGKQMGHYVNLHVLNLRILNIWIALLQSVRVCTCTCTSPILKLYNLGVWTSILGAHEPWAPVSIQLCFDIAYNLYFLQILKTWQTRKGTSLPSQMGDMPMERGISSSISPIWRRRSPFLVLKETCQLEI